VLLLNKEGFETPLRHFNWRQSKKMLLCRWCKRWGQVTGRSQAWI